MLAAVLLAVAVSRLLGGGTSPYEVRAQFEDAGQLVKGNLVKVGGVTIGTVKSIDLTSDNQAQITLRITDPRFHPLHTGTIATIRNTSLSSVAGRQVALQPGPNSNPKIADHGVIGAQDTRPIVDLDQLLNTLDAQARTSLQQLVHGGAVAFGSHPQQADAALAALNPALSQTRQTVADLAGDQATFERALVESAGVVSSVAARAGDLQAGVANGAQVANAVASESQSLDSALRRAPAALKQSNTTLAELRSALTDLRPALRDAQPAAPRLANVLRLAKPVVGEAGPGRRPGAQRAARRDGDPARPAEARRDRAAGLRQHRRRAAGRVGHRPGGARLRPRSRRRPAQRLRRLGRRDLRRQRPLRADRAGRQPHVVQQRRLAADRQRPARHLQRVPRRDRQPLPGRGDAAGPGQVQPVRRARGAVQTRRTRREAPGRARRARSARSRSGWR